MALCTRAAATAESTPPDSAHRTGDVPTWERTACTWDSMIEVWVHDGGQRQMS
jgi:hypothetical protein